MFEFNSIKDFVEPPLTKLIVREPEPTENEPFFFCTEVIAQSLAAHIMRGMTLVESAKYEGIPVKLVKDWYKTGKNITEKKATGHQIYARFYLMMERAKIEYKASILESITKHAYKRWQAAVYILDRMDKKEHERRSKSDMDVNTRVSLFNLVKEAVAEEDKGTT